MKVKYTAKKKAKILNEIANGLTVTEASAKYGASFQTIRNWQGKRSVAKTSFTPKTDLEFVSSIIANSYIPVTKRAQLVATYFQA